MADDDVYNCQKPGSCKQFLITVFANCLNTIDTCLDQSNTTWSFCYYTLNTCNHTLNKGAALHFSCNFATHLLFSATHLLLHTTHYYIHKTFSSKMKSQCTIGKTHLFKIQNTLGNWKYLNTHMKTFTYKTGPQSASYKNAKGQLCTSRGSTGEICHCVLP